MAGYLQGSWIPSMAAFVASAESPGFRSMAGLEWGDLADGHIEQSMTLSRTMCEADGRGTVADGDETFRFQDPKRLAKRRPGDVELLHQHRLGRQGIAMLQLAQDYLAPDTRGDEIPQSSARGRSSIRRPETSGSR